MRVKKIANKRLLQDGQSSGPTASPPSPSLPPSKARPFRKQPMAKVNRVPQPLSPHLNTYHILNRIREREEKALRNTNLPYIVQSPDLHALVAREIVDYLDTNQFCDLMIRCKNNQSFRAHRLILASISAFIKELLVDFPRGEMCVLELPDYDAATVSLLLCLVYNGVIEGTLDDLREAMLLAKNLRMRVPVSKELLDGLFESLPHVHADLLGLWPPAKESVKVVPKDGPAKLERPRTVRAPRSRVSYVPVTSVNTICGDTDRVCALCRETCLAENMADHVRMHDNDPVLRRKRHSFLERLVCASKDPVTSLFKCHVCLRHFTHSGNFKQHLVRHERECGSFSALLISKTKNGLNFDLSCEIESLVVSL